MRKVIILILLSMVCISIYGQNDSSQNLIEATQAGAMPIFFDVNRDYFKIE